MVKNLSVMHETLVGSLGQGDPLEMGITTHSNILAWRIPGTEEPGGLQAMGHTFMIGVYIKVSLKHSKLKIERRMYSCMNTAKTVKLYILNGYVLYVNHLSIKMVLKMNVFIPLFF